MSLFQKIQGLSFIKGKQILCISVNILSNEELLYSAIELKKEKGAIEVVNQFKSTESLQEEILKSYKNKPVIVNVDGKGVFSKKTILENDKTIDDKDFISEILPGAQQDDFLFSGIQAHGNDWLVSIIRKEAVDKILNLFKENKNLVIGFYIGSFKINSIISLLKDDDRVICNNKVFSYNKDNIQDFSLLSENIEDVSQYTIDNDIIYSENLVGFASGLSFFVDDFSGECHTEFINNQKQEASYKNLFIYVGWFILLFFLIILLINFMVFDHYNNKNGELTTQVEQNKTLLSTIDTLEAEIKLKENFIESSSFSESNIFSFYADRVGTITKDGIVLTELAFNPLEKRIKPEIPPDISVNTLLITGVVEKSHILNQYVQDLNKEKWVNSIKITKYEQQNNFKSGEFELLIKL